MLFSSFIFVLFLAIVLPVYYLLSHRLQNLWLLLASYVFYGYWDWRFLSLLALSTAVDYLLARGMEAAPDPRRRKVLVALSVVVNLGILGFFKYFNFFVGSAAIALESMGMEPNLPFLQLVLPVGISFYTFQSMAYTIDVYRGIQPATRDPISFALYVAYFPQLVAGPIERATRLLPQIQKPRVVTQDQWNSGAQLILWGYVKKVVIADGLAPYADAAFSVPESQSGLMLWLGLYCFALQIYCDFAGYSDIARGVSRLMGIELMENFRQPYFSRNITEFWRRWHISLSTWLRDYLYIPLGGNRGGPTRQYRNLMITMLFGGLWHGAAWTFVIWGALHGLYLGVHKYLTGGRKIGQETSPDTPLGWLSYLANTLVTFHLVCLTWIFFRASTLSDAWNYLGGMLAGVFSLFLNGELISGAAPTLVFCAVLVFLLDFGPWLSGKETPLSSRVPWWARGMAYALGLILLAYMREPAGEVFLYFQF